MINTYRLFIVERATEKVPDSAVNGFFAYTPSNYLLLKIRESDLEKITGAANDAFYFPYYAFASMINPYGKGELVKAINILYNHYITRLLIISYIKVDIRLQGPYCDKGARVTHKVKYETNTRFEYQPREECTLCTKDWHEGIGKFIFWPSCKDPSCLERSPVVKRDNEEEFLAWNLQHDCCLQKGKNSFMKDYEKPEAWQDDPEPVINEVFLKTYSEV